MWYHLVLFNKSFECRSRHFFLIKHEKMHLVRAVGTSEDSLKFKIVLISWKNDLKSIR